MNFQVVLLLLFKTAFGDIYVTEYIVDYINRFRPQECPRLVVSECFTESAQIHADQMAHYGRLSYVDLETDEPADVRVSLFGCQNFTETAVTKTVNVEYLEDQCYWIYINEQDKWENCENLSVGVAFAVDMYLETYFALDIGGIREADPFAPQERLQTEDSMLWWINYYREDFGCPSLEKNEMLARAARIHAADMARMGTITHDGSDGSSMWERAWTQGYDGYALENIASFSAEIAYEVVEIWKADPSADAFMQDCKNTDAGVGVYVDEIGLYHWTFMAGYSYPPLGDLDPDGIMNAFIEQANQERECPVPIALDNCLTASAQSQAEDMVDNGFFSSTSSDGTKSGVRVRELFGCQNFRHEAVFATSTKSQTAFFTQYMEGSARAPKILDCTNVLVGIGNKGSRWTFDYAHARLP